MSKKSFSGGINSLLGDNTESKKVHTDNKAPVGRRKTQFKEITKSSQEGTKENETRATFIVNEDLLEKVKAIAYWDRALLKEVINHALENYIKVKNPKPRPEEIRKKEQADTQRNTKKEGAIAKLPKY